jgi:NAD(P)-dependent dehydrogenase (short-subunit alcohol dehydrogenase family)
VTVAWGVVRSIASIRQIETTAGGDRVPRLAGKQAVITGAAGGIGVVACRMFCAEGASVIGSDLSDEEGRQLEHELRGDGLDFSFVRCDVSSSADVTALADQVRSRFGGLDVLYNNAGVIIGKPLIETTDDDWEHVVGVNLRGTFLTMRALVPFMRGRQASIVNTSSGLGLVGSEQMTAYCASKGGVVLLTKAAALELGPDIRVNVICPGVIDTPLPRAAVAGFPEDVRRAVFQNWTDAHVAGRLGRPEEVVSAAIYLASDEASFVTGAAIPVDSGVTAR